MVWSSTMAATSATAEGDIARTPFAHLLIYALDRALTGVIFLQQPDGVEHVIRLVRGAPVKVRPGDGYALLGEMLIEAGAIDGATLEAALHTKSLLGDVLLLAGCVQRDVLEQTAEKQLVRRIVRFFDLPAETTFRYFEGHDALADYGGDPACVDPVALVWAGLAAHAERSTMMEATLARLGDKPMKLHGASTASRFGLAGPEAKLLDHLVSQPATLAELTALGVAPPEVVRRFAYAMMITRQLDLGAGSPPLGTIESTRTPAVAPGGTPRAVARMQLRSTVHRVGAAAPDLPGDGERGVPVVSARSSTRRLRALPPDARADGEPSSASLEPPSSRERLSGDPSTERSSAIAAEPPKAAAPPAEEPRDSGVIEVPESARKERSAAATTTLRSQSAPHLTPADAGIERSHISAGKSVAELLDVAQKRLASRDPEGALLACDTARDDAPDDPDVIALRTWARSQLGGADVKALSVELDELLREESGHVAARYYRAMLRKRLGDQAGCMRDLRQVLEIEPEHEGATREVASAEPKPAPKERPSLFGRLFKR